MKTENENKVLATCIAVLDPAKLALFKLGGVSAGKTPIPGWKMDGVFQMLAENKYNSMSYSQSDKRFVLFVQHEKGKDDRGWLSTVDNPQRNYFRFQFDSVDGRAEVTLSHSLIQMHDIPLKEMNEGWNAITDKAGEEDKRKAWEEADKFRNKHSFRSFSFGMKDEDIRKIEDAIKVSLEYIDSEWG